MGALTNKPMAFNSRNWEYSSQITNDLTEFLTPKIRVDQFSGKIYRILPTVEWISNKIRFLYLGLRNQRIISPLFSYKFTIKIELSKKLISFTKVVILTNRLERSFNILRKRLFNIRKKNINFILGAVFDANINLFNNFERNNTKVNKYFEFSGKARIDKFNFEDANYIFFGFNPRMESPLLNLKIKESQQDVYSIGNFSFQYKVSVLDNGNFGLVQNFQGKMLGKSIAFFGISSLEHYNNYFGKKNLILPIYYLNNMNNFISNNDGGFFARKNVDDVNVYVAPQNLSEIKSNLIFSVTTHFEKFLGTDKLIRIPVSGYLESNFSYLDKDLNTKKINSMKPSFGIADFVTAFNLYTGNTASFSRGKANYNVKENNKVKIFNKLFSNFVPNYLVRDPLTRANQLFNKQ